MPTAMFAAVPRVPPPPRDAPYVSAGLASTLLNSSMLTRMFATPVPESDPLGNTQLGTTGPITDPDTSYYDYENGVEEEPG